MEPTGGTWPSPPSFGTIAAMPPSVIWTIGHSTRPIENFLGMLQAHGIRVAVDPCRQQQAAQRLMACQHRVQRGEVEVEVRGAEIECHYTDLHPVAQGQVAGHGSRVAQVAGQQHEITATCGKARGQGFDRAGEMAILALAAEDLVADDDRAEVQLCM